MRLGGVQDDVREELDSRSIPAEHALVEVRIDGLEEEGAVDCMFASAVLKNTE